MWAIPRLDNWSSMQVFAVMTRPPFWPGPVSGWVTRLHQGLLRSALSGQANAILVSPHLGGEDLGHCRISERGRERRLAHAVRLAGDAVVANLHGSNVPDTPDVVLSEIERSRAFAEGLARPGDVVVLAGDFNLPDVRLRSYSEPAAGVDHVLVKGGRASAPVVWARERRVHAQILLSDHPPVEVTIG